MSFRGKTRSAVVALVLGAATLVVLPSPAHAASASSTYESKAIKATNAERVKRDLKKLKSGKCVEKYAEKWARTMAKKQRLYHQDLGPILKKCKLGMVGENIAYGYPSGKKVVAAWMSSPGHRANILRGKYRRIGLGAYKDSDGRWWVSQVFGRPL